MYEYDLTQNEPRARIRGHFSRTIFTPPNPLIGGTLGSLVANLVFRSKQSLPYQREVWRDCLYSCGLFRKTHKKRIALCYPSCVERKTRLEPPLRVGIFREFIFTPPTHERGDLGSLRAGHRVKQKSSPFGLLFRLSGKRDSNSRPQPWQGCALPTELFPQYVLYSQSLIG